MVGSGVMMPFVWALHGYATARENNEMRMGCLLLTPIPMLADLVFSNTEGYKTLASSPAGAVLIMVLISLAILAGFWLIGYGVGLWRGKP